MHVGAERGGAYVVLSETEFPAPFYGATNPLDEVMR